MRLFADRNKHSGNEEVGLGIDSDPVLRRRVKTTNVRHVNHTAIEKLHPTRYGVSSFATPSKPLPHRWRGLLPSLLVTAVAADDWRLDSSTTTLTHDHSLTLRR